MERARAVPARHEAQGQVWRLLERESEAGLSQWGCRNSLDGEPARDERLGREMPSKASVSQCSVAKARESSNSGVGKAVPAARLPVS